MCQTHFLVLGAIKMEFRKYIKIYLLGHEENVNIFSNPNDEIVIEEKLDGANFRWYINDFGQIIFGSHTQQLSEDKDHKYQKNFERCINHIKEKLYGKDLLKYKGMIFYGECCVKHTINYNWEKIPPFLGFDINNDENENYPKRYLPYPLVKEVYEELGLNFVPVIKVCKASELKVSEINDSVVPDSEYFSLSSQDKKAEGIIFKKYRFDENNKDDGQIFAKYVREKFKEKNKEVFGGGKKFAKDDAEYFTAVYCTNARIDKCIFKLTDEGKKLGMELMGELLNLVYKDIWEENWNEIAFSKKKIDLQKFKQLISKRVLEVLKQVIINNSLI